jgi:DNA-binding response OmpR family regulator
MRILVVENSPGPEGSIGDILRDSGYSVVCSSDIKQAITEVNKGEPFNLIVSDLSFPDLDGFHFLQFLKSRTSNISIPIIIASEITDKASVLRCRQLGARDYIVKPVSKDLLISKIEHVMKNRAESVLVVDDDELILQLLRKVLERQGYRVSTAISGDAALETIEGDNVGIVISDIEMPGMGGLDLLKAVKEKHAQLPVLIVTGRGGKYSKDYILQAGADGYITKPFKNFEILEAVATHMKQVRAAAQA